LWRRNQVRVRKDRERAFSFMKHRRRSPGIPLSTQLISNTSQARINFEKTLTPFCLGEGKDSFKDGSLRDLETIPLVSVSRSASPALLVIVSLSLRYLPVGAEERTESLKDANGESYWLWKESKLIVVLAVSRFMRLSFFPDSCRIIRKTLSPRPSPYTFSKRKLEQEERIGGGQPGQKITFWTWHFLRLIKIPFVLLRSLQKSCQRIQIPEMSYDDELNSICPSSPPSLVFFYWFRLHLSSP